MPFISGEVVGLVRDGLKLLFRTSTGLEVEIDPDQFVESISQDLFELDDVSRAESVLKFRHLEGNFLTKFGPYFLINTRENHAAYSESDRDLWDHFINQSLIRRELFDIEELIVFEGILTKDDLILPPCLELPVQLVHTVVAPLDNTIVMWTPLGVRLMGLPVLSASSVSVQEIGSFLCRSEKFTKEEIISVGQILEAVEHIIDCDFELSSQLLKEDSGSLRQLVMYSREFNGTRPEYEPRADFSPLLRELATSIYLKVVEWIFKRIGPMHALQVSVATVRSSDSRDVSKLVIDALLMTDTDLWESIGPPMRGLFDLIETGSSMVALKLYGEQLGERGYDFSLLQERLTCMKQVESILSELDFGHPILRTKKRFRFKEQVRMGNDCGIGDVVRRQFQQLETARENGVRHVVRKIPKMQVPKSIAMSRSEFFLRYACLGIQDPVNLSEETEWDLNCQLKLLRKSSLDKIVGSISRFHAQVGLCRKLSAVVRIQRYFRRRLRVEWKLHDRLLLKQLERISAELESMRNRVRYLEFENAHLKRLLIKDKIAERAEWV